MVDYDFLDEYQKKVVKTKGKNTLVVAPPGSGKTTVIINRVAYLIKELEVDPSNIVVITFTRAAAMNMKNRYKKITKGRRTPFFGTFHGLFYKILSRYYGKINIIQTKESYYLINYVLTSYLDNVNEDKVRDVLNDISLLKNTEADIESFDSKIDKSIFKNCYYTYEEHKNEKNLLDFDDLQIKMIKLFRENKKLLLGYRKLFKYILVDEFQDCDYTQIRLVQMLGEHNSVFAVGDEDQCIYSFRGSKPECMVDFNEYFKESKKLYLKYNYRSANNIVHISKNLINNNKVRNDKVIEAYNKENKVIKIRNFLNERSQAESIAEEIDEIIKNGYDYKDIAILYRTNIESRSITDLLFKKSIPFTILDKGYNFFNHFICKDILAYMKLSLDTEDKKSFLRIINKPFRYVSKLNTEKVRNYKYEEDCFDILKEVKDIQPFQIKNLEKLQKDIKKIKKMYVEDAINYIVRNLEYSEYIKSYSEKIKVDKRELMEIVEELKESSKGYTSILTFLVHVEAVEDEINKKDLNEESITLSTIHGVKGMEFKNVFIINCNDSNIPYKTYSGEINKEEERRLFYVGITRAIDNLCICTTKLLRGRNVDESPFIKECKFEGLGSKEECFSKEEVIFHKVFGKGTIKNINKNIITIVFSDNIERQFDIDTLIRGKIINKIK
ncbi:ATP-dependent helicase [Clostridium oceanicum]|uniref:DNA 3'-5' helicase n=1 Tax=Clostridium oceanicum TaxID=1543 RepID=A0ABP3UV28_9CLOT